jgi:hypothetical protein
VAEVARAVTAVLKRMMKNRGRKEGSAQHLRGERQGSGGKKNSLKKRKEAEVIYKRRGLAKVQVASSWQLP